MPQAQRVVRKKLVPTHFPPPTLGPPGPGLSALLLGSRQDSSGCCCSGPVCAWGGTHTPGISTQAGSLEPGVYCEQRPRAGEELGSSWRRGLCPPWTGSSPLTARGPASGVISMWIFLSAGHLKLTSLCWCPCSAWGASSELRCPGCADGAQTPRGLAGCVVPTGPWEHFL